MVAVLDIRQKQRAVIEFLCCENDTVGNVHKRLKNMYGDDAVDRRTVSRWARRLSGESGTPIFGILLATADPPVAQTSDNVQLVSDMALGDKRVPVKEMSVKLGIGEASVCRILKYLVEKILCKVDPEDVDRCPQRKPKNCMQ
jgi:hypothetical protein